MESSLVDGFLELTRGSKGQGPGDTVAPGETTDAEFSKRQAIEFRDFRLNCGEENTSSLGDDKAPKRWKFVFEISKLTDSSSPYLYYLFCQNFQKPKAGSAAAKATSCTEQELKDPSSVIKAAVSLRKAGGQPFVFLVFRFSCVGVHSYELSWEDGYLKETVKFNAKKCVIEYHAQDQSGKVDKRYADVKSSFRQLKGWDFSEPKTK